MPLFGAKNLQAFIIANAAHFFIRNALVVIDDLERHSAGLPIRDILGVLTGLKEERACQIIIVTNEDALGRDGTDASYFETKEKVIDQQLSFEPTVDDAIAIALGDYSSKNQAAAEGCRKLGISNIRTVQKIDSTLRQLRNVLNDINVPIPESFDLQLQTTTVFATWAYWERVIDIDDLEKLQLGDTGRILMESGSKLPEPQQNLYRRAREYGYHYSDDTDKIITRYIKSGVIDRDEMRVQVQENQIAVERRIRAEAIDRAWDTYRRTLRPNADEVVNSLYDAHMAGLEDVETANLSQAVWILGELGQGDKADDLIDRFLNRKSPIGTYEDYPFKDLVRDEEFMKRWKEHDAKEVPDERDIDTTINSFYADKTINMGDIRRLSQFTANEFHQWFSTTENPEVLSIAKALVRIGHRPPLMVKEIAKVEAEVSAALRRISAGSTINRLRLRSLFPEDDVAQQPC